jgi:EAL domain-containing protein (putative c-di-GMP-specific phosphodiesterase class I)
MMAMVQLEIELKRAVENQEWLVYFQPIVSLESGMAIGMEALVRWQHPERGLVPPLEFIPIAEETGLVTRIDEWVLRRACHHVASHCTAEGNGMLLAVNVSPRHLHSPMLVATVKAALEESGLPPERLEIELTETAVISDIEASSRILDELRALGVSVALDDFGTGYASLSHLHRLPIDRVKIDRSFVSRVEEDESAASIVSALVGLAQSLRLGTVAEGVETQAQLAFLQGLGCDDAQGYFLARPAPAELCAAFRSEGAAAFVSLTRS